MLHVSSERENSEGFRNGKRDFDHQILSDIVENSAKEFCCKILNYKSNVLFFFLILKQKSKHMIFKYCLTILKVIMIGTNKQ